LRECKPYGREDVTLLQPQRCFAENGGCITPNRLAVVGTQDEEWLDDFRPATSVFLLHFDLDGFRFCLLSLLNPEIQHAVLEQSANFSFIDIVRQRKATGEAPVVSLDSMELLSFLM